MSNAALTPPGASDEWLSRSLIEIREVVRELTAVLGAPVISDLAGQKDKKIAYRWVHADGPLPRAEAQRRLYAFYRVWLRVGSQIGQSLAVAWFTAGHPTLGERSPLDAFKAGEVQAVSAAADELGVHPIDVKFRSGETPQSAHWHTATLLDARALARENTGFFGARLTSTIAGEVDRKAAYRWMRADGPLPSFEARRRLAVVHRVRCAISAMTSPALASHWFVAASPELNEQMPLQAAIDNDMEGLGRSADRFLQAAASDSTRSERVVHLLRTSAAKQP